MKKRTVIFLTALFFILISIFCFFPYCNNPKAPSKELKTAFKADPQTLDTRKAFDFISASLHFLLYAGLTEIQSDGSITLNLAESYTLSKDGIKYTFYLKEDAFWSDGTKITAKDFELSWKEALTPSFFSPTSTLFYPIKNAEKIANAKLPIENIGIKAVDDKTLVIELEKPTPHFLYLTSFSSYFPMPSYKSETSTPQEKLIFSGPFVLKTWKRNQELHLQKNSLFWNRKQVFLKKIQIQIIDNDNTALALFETGKLDFISSLLCPLPLDSLSSLKAKKELSQTPIASTSYLAFNCEHPDLKNQDLRKALSLAINRSALTKNITKGGEEIAASLTPPLLYRNALALQDTKEWQNKSKTPNLKINTLFQDLDLIKAKTFWQQAQKKVNLKTKKQPLILTYEANPLAKKIAEAIKTFWEENLNLSVQLLGLERKTFFNTLKNKKYDIALTNIVAQYPHPLSFLERFKEKNSKNYALWENQNFQHLIKQKPLSLEKLLDLEQILIDEMAVAPLYHHSYLTVQKSYVKGVKIGLIGDLHLEKIYFEDHDSFNQPKK